MLIHSSIPIYRSRCLIDDETKCIGATLVSSGFWYIQLHWREDYDGYVVRTIIGDTLYSTEESIDQPDHLIMPNGDTVIMLKIQHLDLSIGRSCVRYEVDVFGETYYSARVNQCGNPCWQLTYWNECYGDGGYFGDFDGEQYKGEIFIEDIDFTVNSYVETIENITDQHGNTKVIYRRTYDKYDGKLIVQKAFYNQLSRLREYDNLVLTSSDGLVINAKSIEISGGQDESVFVAVLSIVDSNYREYRGCCTNYYNSENPCEPLCSSALVISCVDDQLIASTGIDGYTYVWGNGIIGSTQAALSGSYTVSAYKEGCDTLTEEITVHINSAGEPITTNPIII